MRRLALVAVLAVSALGLLAGSSSADTYRKCVYNKQAGVLIHNHIAAIVYCGSAKATLKTGGKTSQYKGGACLDLVGSMIVGIGKYTTGTHASLYTAFYLVMPLAQDGSSKLAVLTIQHKGKPTLSAGKVAATVSGKRSRGTFSGKFTTGAKFSGSFTCK
jgi:hypothetical protein